MTERESQPTVVYGSDINALTLVAHICKEGAFIESSRARQSRLRRAAEMCTALASNIKDTGLEPLEDEDWYLWPSQVAAVEDGTTDLPTAEMLLDTSDLSHLRTARLLRTYRQISELPVR